MGRTTFLQAGGVKIVPMIVGDLKSLEDGNKFADLLLEYFLQDENLFIISSDFCHWGPRYSYFYLEEPQPEDPIHATIEGFMIISSLRGSPFVGGIPSASFCLSV
ncbi:uncharacterized protein EMH_0079980 [Eimeria mitis]|uniref:Uncharacterized protein n=1 Tax=Eimeria mitis TaxID=44415 RepID=U6K8D9_9EIME|nr:uncharacterized protein EMH_0079980 [Eimeria mitis]CDJ33091.1 hypothetical protein, conserved [Eimeria mitis]